MAELISEQAMQKDIYSITQRKANVLCKETSFHCDLEHLHVLLINHLYVYHDDEQRIFDEAMLVVIGADEEVKSFEMIKDDKDIDNLFVIGEP